MVVGTAGRVLCRERRVGEGCVVLVNTPTDAPLVGGAVHGQQVIHVIQQRHVCVVVWLCVAQRAWTGREREKLISLGGC